MTGPSWTVHTVLPKFVSFEQLAASLAERGWQREPDRAGMNLGRDEPVFVSWSLPLSDGEIDYSFDPDVGEKWLDIRGLDAEAYQRELLAVLQPASLFAASPGQTRRQILRWLLAEHSQTSSSAIEAVLEAAFTDIDWETRVTAVVAAARLRASRLADAVRRCDLSGTTISRPTAHDRQIVDAVQKLSIRVLENGPLPGDSAQDRDWRHLLRCLLGQTDDSDALDHIYVLLHSLTQPLPSDAPPPSQLPNGIVTNGRNYLLRGTSTELQWVPPVPHWLGDDFVHPGTVLANPIRRERHPEGYFISMRPIGQPVTHDEAVAACAERALATDAQARLPTSTEWEMAARGPDGRMFPWGNGLESEWRTSPSPWGVYEIMISPEWTSDGRVHGQYVVCGTRTDRGCATYRLVLPTSDERAVFRVVVPV
jgi:Sulfatase-modifying factor enzyme 1